MNITPSLRVNFGDATGPPNFCFNLCGSTPRRLLRGYSILPKFEFFTVQGGGRRYRNGLAESLLRMAAAFRMLN